MLFLGHPVYEIAKSGLKIGLSALKLGYIWIFKVLAQKLLSVRSIASFFETLCTNFDLKLVRLEIFCKEPWFL